MDLSNSATKFAVNIEMWYQGDFVSRIEQAHAQGFEAIEFWLFEEKDIEEHANGVEAIELPLLNEQVIRAGAERLEELGMVATQFTAWPFCKELNDPQQSPEKFLGAIRHACEVAKMLPGCDLFTVVLGDDVDGVSREDMHRAVVEKLKLAVPILEQAGMTAIIEPMNPYNHPDHCFYGSAEGVAVCEAVGSRHVLLNYDLFHMQRFEGNLIDNLRKCREWIGYLQLADSPDRHEPGTGEVNYAPVLEAAREIGYTGYVGLECMPQDGDTERALKRILAVAGTIG